MILRLLFACLTLSAFAAEPGVVRAEFIFETNPVPSCHATTIGEAKDGTLVAAWFAGEAEGKPDVSIWTARFVDGKWSAPVKVAEGTQRMVKASFLAAYGYFRPEYSQLYLNEYSALKSIRAVGFDTLLSLSKRPFVANVDDRLF